MKTTWPSSIPNHGDLIVELLRLIKAARAPLANEEEQRIGLTLVGWRCLGRLAVKLRANLYFEHIDFKTLQDQLWELVSNYKATAMPVRPKDRQLAEDFVTRLARAPTRQTAYLGIHHLDLPNGTVVGGVHFLHPGDEEGLAEAFSGLRGAPPQLVCAVEVEAGTDELALARAQRLATTALGLVRQKILFGFRAKIYPGQVAFDLDRTYTWKRDGTLLGAGWWGGTERPMDTDLSSQTQWADGLRQLSEQRDALDPRLRERVDTCLDWLDVAARSTDWRVIIPAVFSAMEAILVPESSGLKAGAVTVRSVAVHVALEHAFFHPGETVAGYEWRSSLVHGEPTYDVSEAQGLEFAEDRQHWAFLVFSDYLTLVTQRPLRSIREVVAFLDADPAKEVCRWLKENGGHAVVEEYRKMVSGSERSSEVLAEKEHA